LEEHMERKREDKYLKHILKEIESGGPRSMMKY
jgi:hypothetical protein